MSLRIPAVLTLALAVVLSLSVSGAKAAEASTSLPAVSGGVVLDGFGGLHPFGGVTVDTAGAPYWQGWDIARSVALLSGGAGGWELDGWGGIHPFGAAPALPASSVWHGWDIARALVVDPDAQGGYVLDGWGGLHPFGNAPALSGNPYWPGWYVAAGLDIHYNLNNVPDGGWTLDAWGGIHAFGAAPQLPSAHYYSGLYFWRGFHATGNGAGAYLVGGWGIVDSTGNAAGIQWSGYPTWGAWNIARDTAPLNATGAWNPPPVNRPGAGAMMAAVNNLDRAQRGLPQLTVGGTLINIAGAGAGFNLGGCGGSGTIADRSQDMFNRNYFAHTIPGCSSTDYVWQTYFRQYGVSYSYAGENIAWVSLADLPDAVWQVNHDWLNSPEHLANIVSSHFKTIGCGGSTGSGYQGQSGTVWIWTCDFTG